jgi:hypothetical protein
MIAVSFRFPRGSIVPLKARQAGEFFLDPEMIAQSCYSKG